MKYRTIAISPVILMVACSSEAEHAQERYNALASIGASSEDLCGAARDVAVAWAMEGDNTRADLYSSMSQSHCISAAARRSIVGG